MTNQPSLTRLAGGLVLLDVVDELPVHRRKRWKARPVDGIERLYVHHSGRLGRDGLDGFKASAAYSSRDKQPRRKGGKVRAGWPGTAYQVWLPYNPVLTDGALTAFRGNPDDRRTYHTGGEANTHGWSICLQGNTSVDGISDSQVELLEGLLPWALERFGLELPDGLSWHSDSKRFGGSGKASCPGSAAVAWLTAYRGAARPALPVG